MSANRHIATMIVLGSSAAAFALPAAAPAQAASIDLEAHLRPTAAFPRVHGQAEFDREGRFREFEISVHHAGTLAGHLVRVRVDGHLVGRMRVHADGFAHLDRHVGVPNMSAGDVVRVRTAAGRLVTRGVFRADTD